MVHQRPLECPACGHERIARRPVTRRTETHVLRVKASEWWCQLCAYSWSYPISPKSSQLVETD